MGMLPSHIALLAKEQKKHPLRGKVLTLGQQAVYSTLAEVEEILESQNIALSTLKDGFDVTSKINKGSKLWDKRTNAQTVLSLMGANEVLVGDCSQYENPDFLMDLNFPVGEEYFEKFDVILDIGTSEHVFNIPMLLRNLNFMLKKGGEIILMNPTSNTIDHGFYSISPTLFFDYFAANNYENFNCYLCEEDPEMLFLEFPPPKVNVYRYDYVGNQFCFLSNKAVETIFFATKNINCSSGEFKTPSQSLYTRQPNWKGDSIEKDVKKQGKKNNVLVKVKPILKLMFKKLKPFLPSRLLSEILILYYSGLRKKIHSPNLTYIGNIKCSSNIVNLSSHTTVRLEE